MKEGKANLIVVSAVLLILIVPAILIVISAQWIERTALEEAEYEELGAEKLIPSKILDDKSAYMDQFVIVRGQVIPEEVVCERISCPPEDSCCGCPKRRNLIIIDPSASIIRQLPGKLLLLTEEKEPLCYREEDSCDYECPDWQIKGLYEVRGIFRATPPPLGTALRIYFEYYLEAQEKDLVKTVGIFDRLGALFTDLKEFITRSTSETYYIID